MSFYDITQLLIRAICAFLVALAFYVFFSEDTTYIVERLKRNKKVVKKRHFIDDLLKIIKPVTEANMKSNKNKDLVKQMFIKLGMSATEIDIMDFENRRMLFMFITVIVSLVCSLIFLLSIESVKTDSKILFSVVSVCLPSFIVYKFPTWKLQKRIKAKEKAFEKHFPDAIDLLCVCVEAGLSIDGAIERVGREFSNFSYDVGYEFNRIAKDMLSGVSKQDAFRGLAERVENKDIQSFVAIIIQAEKMGSSISNSLAICADSLRTKRKQRLEELVASASTKMTVPLVLFLLPATFAVILAPAIIKVIENLGKMNGF